MGPSGARVTLGRALLGLAVLLPACTTTRQSDPVGLDLNQPIRTEPVQAWRLTQEATTLGYVVLFADPSAPTRVERQYFSVRNPWHQELGTIDGLGRAWRFLPHQPEPEWLSTGTVRDGAIRILGAPPSAGLEEVPLEVLAPRASTAGG